MDVSTLNLCPRSNSVQIAWEFIPIQIETNISIWHPRELHNFHNQLLPIERQNTHAQVSWIVLLNLNRVGFWVVLLASRGLVYPLPNQRWIIPNVSRQLTKLSLSLCSMSLGDWACLLRSSSLRRALTILTGSHSSASSVSHLHLEALAPLHASASNAFPNADRSSRVRAEDAEEE